MSGKRQTRGRNVQQSVESLDRHVRALELRKAGVGYRQIAEALGYANASGAFKAVQRSLREVKHEAADKLLALEIERLDQMLVAISQAVRSGNFGAIDRALRIAERRAKLLGLDSATKVDLKQTATHVFTLKIGDRLIKVRDERDEDQEETARAALAGDAVSALAAGNEDVDGDEVALVEMSKP